MQEIFSHLLYVVFIIVNAKKINGEKQNKKILNYKVVYGKYWMRPRGYRHKQKSILSMFTRTANRGQRW